MLDRLDFVITPSPGRIKKRAKAVRRRRT